MSDIFQNLWPIANTSRVLMLPDRLLATSVTWLRLAQGLDDLERVSLMSCQVNSRLIGS